MKLNPAPPPPEKPTVRGKTPKSGRPERLKPSHFEGENGLPRSLAREHGARGGQAWRIGSKWLRRDSIYTLLEQGYSHRSIARTLGIDRATVRRHAEWVTGRAQTQARRLPAPKARSGLPIQMQPGRLPGRWAALAPSQPSVCEPFRQVILDKLEQGPVGPADLAGPGERARLCRQLLQRAAFRAEAAAPARCPSGGWSVDRGRGPGGLRHGRHRLVEPDGRRRRTARVPRVLSHSRKGYSEAVLGRPPRTSSVPGERLLALRRGAADAGDRQSEGGGQPGRTGTIRS